MASLFPEIEVFTTENPRLWSLDWIKHTPMKFAKELKVLDLTGFKYNKNFSTNFDAVLDKLKADGVSHIGMVLFPKDDGQQMEGEERTQCFLEAECIAKISSRATVGHILLHDTSLEDMYTICAQVNDMYSTNPIHLYFTDLVISRSIYVDPQRPLRLLYSRHLHLSSEFRDPNVEIFYLNSHFNGRKMDAQEVPTFPSTTHLLVKDGITVHLQRYNLSDWEGNRTRLPLSVSLEDFPHIEIKFDYMESHPRQMCSDLEIAAEHEWPTQRNVYPMFNTRRDMKAACFDSKKGRSTIPSDEVDAYTILNIPESLEKISPPAGLQHPIVTVAVLDTGVLSSHQVFLHRIVAMKNFVPNEVIDLYYDVHGHGTSCAGIVLQSAPFVRLVVCKVLSSQGPGQLKWAADAIDWLLNDEDGPKKYCPVDIISMSFGSDAFDSDVRRAVSEAVACGKVVVAAASNDGRKKVTNIAFPARFGDVICVGSCNSLGQPSSFTPTGREIDFLVPGEDIPSPSSAGVDSYLPMTGTSQATPIVAGIAAMVISYAGIVGGQDMRSAVSHTAVVREVLRKMASMPGHHEDRMGYGNLDPMRLFKYGPDHFRQVVEEIVGPLPVLQPTQQDAQTQTDEVNG
ncbi:uncharacterized protein LOC144864361 [Branchiostoma floridae x Branchiostoma japonicum]